MKWLMFLAAVTGFADQTEWVRKLETGVVKDPDAHHHRSFGVTIARGAYGLTHDAWTEVSDLPWIMAHNRTHAERACALYLDLTYKRLRSKLNRPLTFADVYAGYRFGASGYLRMGGKITSTPASFQKKMRDYHVLYQPLTK